MYRDRSNKKDEKYKSSEVVCKLSFSHRWNRGYSYTGPDHTESHTTTKSKEAASSSKQQSSSSSNSRGGLSRLLTVTFCIIRRDSVHRCLSILYLVRVYTAPPPAPRSTPKSCIHSSRERAWWYWRRRWLPLFLFVCCSRPALSRIYARQVDIDELPIVFYQHTFLFIFIFIFVIFFLSLSFLSDFSLMKYGLRHTSIGWFNKIHEDLSLYKPGWCERVSIRLRVRACTNNLS